MNDCNTCIYAEMDYEEYYGTTKKQWFVCGCKKDIVPEECEDCDEYEELL